MTFTGDEEGDVRTRSKPSLVREGGKFPTEI